MPCRLHCALLWALEDRNLVIVSHIFLRNWLRIRLLILIIVFGLSSSGCLRITADAATPRPHPSAIITEKHMDEKSDQKERLISHILGLKGYEAEVQAKAMDPADADAVITAFAGHKDPRVRIIVLEVAVELKTPATARLILQALNDKDSQVRNLAESLVGYCAYESLLPDLMSAMEKHSEPTLRGELSLQVGRVGNTTHIPILHKYLDEARRKGLTALVDTLFLALARLKDPAARRKLIKRLESLEGNTRVSALQDCLYVKDNSLVAYFVPAITDYRDYQLITVPEDPEQLYARICDIAVKVMHDLGYSLSFEVPYLERYKRKALDEARNIAAQLPKQ